MAPKNVTERVHHRDEEHVWVVGWQGIEGTTIAFALGHASQQHFITDF